MDTEQAPIIRFSGRLWRVKISSEPIGPGPNTFLAGNVVIDPDGRLQLSITRSPAGWSCAEVVGLGDFGYGTYRWSLLSHVTGFDASVVLGMFTWSDEAAHVNRELDIEFSRWGDPTRPVAGGFTVQRPDRPATHSFTPQAGPSEHTLSWSPGRVRFRSRFGTIVHEWIHEGPDVPTPGGGVAPRMNLWLFRGRAPRTELSVTIESFDHRPIGGRGY